jgi:hypothetical protein
MIVEPGMNVPTTGTASQEMPRGKAFRTLGPNALIRNE